MKSRMFLVAPALLAALTILVQTSSARLGETLQQCEARYGSAKLLLTPDTISARGVKAYEFRREPYTIVAVIGDRMGAVQVSYYKTGRFSTSELVDLMQRNSSDSEPPSGGGSFEPEQGFMRQIFHMSDIDGECNVGKHYSGLTVVDELKMVKQGDGVALSSYSQEFALDYHKKLESGASDAAADRVKKANDGL